MRSNFRGFVFRGSYFHVLVVGRENHKNLDLTEISRYTVCFLLHCYVNIATVYISLINTHLSSFRHLGITV